MFKNARKIIMGATLALVMGVSVVGVNAETPKEEGPFYQETEININVEKGVIEEPGDGGDGGDGGSSKGDLSIWLKPSKMNFSGKFHENGYTLPLTTGGDKGSENEHEYRTIAVADVRAQEIGWELKANLSELKNLDDGAITEKQKITEGYYMTMDILKHGKYKMKDDELVKPLVIDNEVKNGVGVNPDTRINVGSESTLIASTKIPSDVERPGKLYNGIKFNNINMNFETGKGFEGNFSGQVQWTLTNAID